MVMVPPPPSCADEISVIVPKVVKGAGEPEMMPFNRAGSNPSGVVPVFIGVGRGISEGRLRGRAMSRGGQPGCDTPGRLSPG